jgi:hypothetical protein
MKSIFDSQGKTCRCQVTRRRLVSTAENARKNVLKPITLPAGCNRLSRLLIHYNSSEHHSLKSIIYEYDRLELIINSKDFNPL